MLSTKLRRVVRRVKRIREQEKAIGKIRLFRGKHAGLASSVGVPPEKEPTGNQLSHGSHGVKKALAVAGSVTGTGRAEAPGLPEGQVATQDGKSAFGEGVCQRNQQRGLSIGAGAVSERQAVSVRLGWGVDEASDGRISRGIMEVVDLRIGGHVPQALKLKRKGSW